MFFRRNICLLAGLLTITVSSSPRKRHRKVLYRKPICTAGVQYCGSEILEDFNETSIIYTCNKKGDDWIPSACSKNEKCVVLPEKEKLNAICLNTCNPRSVYCGFELAKMGYEVFRPNLQSNSLYYCENTVEIKLHENCFGYCVSHSDYSLCKQTCEPGLIYCGNELNSLEDFGQNYLPNSLYRCNIEQSVDFIANCTDRCETSTTNSFCSSHSYSACELNLKSLSRVKRVHDGTEANSGQWPWIVALKMSGRHFCSGVLIDSEWILTTAHCIFDKLTSRIEVVLGNRYWEKYAKGELRLTADNISIYENYDDETIENDIGLLHLETPVRFSSHIRPLCLSELSVNEARDCVVAGWGGTKLSPSSSVLQEGEISIMSKEECLVKFREARQEQDFNETQFICAGKRNVFYTFTCEGDSGGPLMCQNDNGIWVGVGLTSWGSKHDCTQAAKAFHLSSLFTRVSTYLPWIENKTGLQFDEVVRENHQDSHEKSQSKGSLTTGYFSFALVFSLFVIVIFLDLKMRCT